MKSPLVLFGLAALALATAGCQEGYVETEGPTPVYGGFGYVEPFDYGEPWYDAGVVVSHPPYRREADDRARAGDRDRGGPAPAAAGRGRSEPARPPPSGHAPARAMPSIPSAPRPSSGGGRAEGGGGSGERKKP